MSIWQQLRAPWQKLRGKNNDNDSKNYHDKNDGPIVQTATTATTTNTSVSSSTLGMSSEASMTLTGMIITDDVAFHPILDFEAYSDTIVKMITQSHPKFSIGIYGEWGTGKTTLMRVVEDKLKNNEDNILTVWFNAWRYEREDQFAIVALLKTIGYAMGKHPIYKELKPILLNAVKIIGRGFLSEIASRYIG